MIIEDTPKIMIIGSKASVLTSGAVQNYLFLKDFLSNSVAVEKIALLAENCANAYKYFRLKKIQHDVLPKFGLGFLEEYFTKQKTINDFLVGVISSQIELYNLYVDLIIAGIDESPHIFLIGHPGTYSSFDLIGFCCSGSGGAAAQSVFDYYKYTTKMPEDEVLKIIYCAKKRSERIGGIGEETDIKIIDANGIRDIQEGQLLPLAAYYKSEKENNLKFFG